MVRTIIDKDSLENLYREGFSQKTIANKLGISIYTIRENFKFHNIKTRKGHSEHVRKILAEKSFKDAKKEYVCKNCGKSFKEYKSRGREPLFCSRECYYDYWKYMRNRTKICQICGVEYTPRVGEYDSSKYCSMTCLWESLKTEPKAFICEHCGKMFFKKNTNHEYRFCSQSCTHAFKGRTGIEKKVFDVLIENGIEFEEQKQFGRFCVDFFIEPNIVIECDGEYWHNKPEVVERDLRKNKYLSKHGLIIYRLNESVINDSMGGVVLEVLNNG